MGEPVLNLSPAELQKIDHYVQSHLPEWVERSKISSYKRDWEWDLLERLVRVEAELKGQRELMKQGLEILQKQMDSRFESMEKRLSSSW